MADLEEASVKTANTLWQWDLFHRQTTSIRETSGIHKSACRCFNIVNGTAGFKCCGCNYTSRDTRLLTMECWIG